MNQLGKQPEPIHGSAVGFAGRGVLILGASGSGKSRLALQLIARGADLVADDRVLLAGEGGAVHAAAPAALLGLVEARGVGILRLQPSGTVRLELVVDLDDEPESRLPERRTMVLLGQHIQLIKGRSVPDLDAIVTLLMEKGAVLC